VDGVSELSHLIAGLERRSREIGTTVVDNSGELEHACGSDGSERA